LRIWEGDLAERVQQIVREGSYLGRYWESKSSKKHGRRKNITSVHTKLYELNIGYQKNGFLLRRTH